MAVIQSSDADFKEYISSNDKVAIKYYADWCGLCKIMAPKYKRFSEDEKYKEVKFLEINSEHNPQSLKAVNVDNLPFFAVFKNGELLEGTATSQEEYIAGMLDKIL